MKIGSAGVFYCKETQSFTTPFLVYSEPGENQIIKHVWAGEWHLPFRIHALGTPVKQMTSEIAKAEWAPLKGAGAGGVSAALNITGTTVFVPKEVTSDDWAYLLRQLADF